TRVYGGGAFIAKNSGSTLWFNDNVTINGTIVWNNETVRMNGTGTNVSFGIIVLGNLTIENGTNITNGEDAAWRHFVFVNTDARFLMNGSHLSRAGANNGVMTGLYSLADNTTIVNSTFAYNYRTIWILGNAAYLAHNIINHSDSRGLMLDGDNNTVFSNRIDDSSLALDILYGQYGTYYGNTLVGDYAIYLNDAYDNLLYDNTILGTTRGLTYYQRGGNNTFRDSSISGTQDHVYWYVSGGYEVNQTFLNVTFDNTLMDWSNCDADDNCSLYVQWYLDVLVNDTDGSNVSGATVEINSSAGGLSYLATTDGSGRIRTQNVSEYRMWDDLSGGYHEQYFTNYTIRAYNGTHSATVSWNLTGNDWANLTLTADNQAPVVALNNPPNGSSTAESWVLPNATVTDSDSSPDTWLWAYSQDQGEDYTGLDEGLVVLLHFNNDSSVGENDTYAYDWSGNNHNATAASDPPIVPDGFGRFKGGLEFEDQESDYNYYVQNMTGLNNLTSFTWNIWIYPETYTNQYGDPWNVIMNKVAKYLRFNNSGKIQVGIATDSTYHTAESNDAIPLDDWSMVTVVYDGSAPQIFINGEEVSYFHQDAGSGTDNDDSASNLMFGYANGGWSWNYRGYMDEFGMWNRSLTGQEILALYDRGRYKLIMLNQSVADGTDLLYNLSSMPLSVQPGMVLLFRFDNDSRYENDTHVYDWTGNDRNGTINLTYPVAGLFGKAMYFNSILGESEIDAGDIDALEGLSGFTVSAWITTPLAQEGDNRGIAQIYGPTNPQRIFQFTVGRITATGTVQFWVSNGSVGVTADSNDQYDWANEWHLVTGVYDSPNVMLYVDGVLQDNIGTLEGVTPTGVTRSLIVGEGSDGGNFNGSLDDFAVWNRSLSAAEIADLYRLSAGRYTWKANASDGEFTAESEEWWFEVNNSAPSIDSISYTASVDPYEGGVNNMSINVTVSDRNGVADIDDGSFVLTVNRSGTAVNASCTAYDQNATSAIYNCTVPLWYFYEAGQWDINATVADLSGLSATNDTESFTYNTLQAVQFSETALTFDSVNIGEQNVTALQNPTRINNTGNVDIGTINISAFDLVGFTNATYRIPAANFSVNTTDACGGTVLSNATNITISQATLPAGNNSYEELYFCLREVPAGIISQDYNTTYSKAWWLFT
ncbi:LamG domain-containing protein, partial [Candidatus Woesearchaeota archaeon]|nr:LamG domain-containing protein [Candidatus Woesearchaeota archaeon]